MGTTGKNLQKPEPVADDEMAYEIGPVSPSATIATSTRVFSSLASHQQGPSAPSPHLADLRPVRCYGGRKLRYKWQHQLKPWQVDDWYRADQAAMQLGTPLNTFVTIFWEATYPGSAAMASTFRLGMKRMAQWLRDNNCRVAFVYVHENPDDAKLNTHLLVHVPKQLRRMFQDKVEGWFDALDGGVKAEPRNDDKRLARRQGTRLQYMAKGADDITCRRYQGRRAKGGQGPINIKRSGTAQCLRPKSAEFFNAFTREPGHVREQYAPAREETL